MAFTDLDQAREDAGYRISTYTQELAGDDDPSAGLFAISWEHRQLAICKLLQDADIAGYQIGLRRSALAWLHLLKQIDGGVAPQPRMMMGSSWSCLAGVVAANDFTLGRRLARRFPNAYDDEREYGDAYFPLAALAHVMTDDTGAPGLSAFCERWELAIAGDPSSGLEAWRALAGRDAPAFATAFADHVAARTRQMTAYRKSFSSIRTIGATEGGLFIEGLAMLQIANALGLPLPAPLPMCPSVALVPPPGQELPDEAWRDFEA